MFSIEPFHLIVIRRFEVATGEKRVLAVNSALLIFIHELKTTADEPDHHQCVLDEVASYDLTS